MQGITLVGPGRLGGALAIALSRSGYSIDRLVYRSIGPARVAMRSISPKPKLERFDRLQAVRSPILIIATPDQTIINVSRELSNITTSKTHIFHTSGSLSSDVLEPFRRVGCPVASFHPLASISSAVTGSKKFEGAYFCVEGDPSAVRTGKIIARKLGGKPFTIRPESKTIYHAGAVCAAGHVVALFDVALSLMDLAGISREMARRMLRPLLDGTAENLINQDTAEALTGTFARADEDALDRQIHELLENASKQELDVYLSLAERSLDLAGSRGIDASAVARMRKRILLAKGKSR